MAKYKLKAKTVNDIKNGEKLIQYKDFINEEKAQHFQEGAVITMQDEANNFVGKLLVGRQNKGLGWLITDIEEEYWSEGLAYYYIEEAIAQRENFFEDSQTTAFRLFNGEGDGIGGMTVDFYDHYLHINWYSEGLYTYREWIVEALKEILPQAMGIYETLRFKTDNQEAQVALTSGEPAPQPLIIKENGISYAVYLGESWMTGIFLDQREVRQFIQTQAQDMTLLNLFSYTGAFSVAAAVGGASKTISVDVANRSLSQTQEQFDLNGIDWSDGQEEIRVMDVFDYIAYAKRHQLTFDRVVCDPPSFARTKKYTFSAEKDYQELAHDLFTLTAVDGMTVISTNHAGYRPENFRRDILEVAQKHPGTFHLIQQFGLPEDFPTSQDSESQYLKVLIFYRQA